MDTSELSDELSLWQTLQKDSSLSDLYPTIDNHDELQLSTLAKHNKKTSIYIKGKDLAQGRDKIMLDEAGRRIAIEIGIKTSF